MKKNQKKLMAVFAAVLMVSFLITAGPQSSLVSGARNRGPAIATIGKTEVYNDERKAADIEWKAIADSYYIDPPDPRMMSFMNQMGSNLARQPSMFQYIQNMAEREGVTLLPAAQLVGSSIAEQMGEHSDLFLLLIKEAELRGINISDDVIENCVKNHIHPLTIMVDPATYRNAVHHLLVVQALRNQLVSNVKFSQPEWQHGIADNYRQIRLNLVEFNGEKLAHDAAPPTTQQVETLYDAYKNVLPDAAPKKKDDSLAFAYEVPNRVKLQYVTIPRTEALAAAREAHRDSKDNPGELPYDLRERAFEYYYNNKAEFVRAAPQTKPATAPSDLSPSTQATTAPATNPATTFAATEPATLPTTVASTTQPTTVASASPETKPAAPTTRPFTEVQDEIVTKLIKTETDDLQKKVADAVRQKLADAYSAGAKNGPTTLPTTPPATQPAGAFSYADLEAIRLDIQKQFKISLEITQIAEWQDAKGLAAIAGIGTSVDADRNEFAEYIADHAAAFAPLTAHKSGTLQLGQPSPLFSDSHENSYVFRLTEAEPAHAPDLASVQARVEADARQKIGYDLAQDSAKKFLELAKKKDFNSAAIESNRPVISTGSFSLASRQPVIPNFSASPASISLLLAKATDLLADASNTNPTPIAIIPMPSDRRVVIAQLADVKMQMWEDLLYGERLEANRSVIRGSEPLAKDYFSYDTVVKRIGYKPTAADKSGD